MNTRTAGTRYAIASLLLLTAFWLAVPPANAHDGPHDINCGGLEIIIEGGHPSPFTLPAQIEETIEFEPDAVLTIRGVNLPPDTTLHWGVKGLGTELAGKDLELNSGVTTVDLADFSDHARGIYEVEGTLLISSIELCTVPFTVDISGFGGTTAIAATGVAAVAGAGALASAPLAANGLNAKLDAKVQIARRRPRGWRRVLPVPAWKRSIISTLVGAVTGLGLAVLMQQAGVSPLSLANAVWGLVLGGGVSFGVGYSLGVLKTFLRPPLEK